MADITSKNDKLTQAEEDTSEVAVKERAQPEWQKSEEAVTKLDRTDIKCIDRKETDEYRQNKNNEVEGDSCWENFLQLGDAYDVALEKLEGFTTAEIIDYIDNSVYKGLLSVYSPQDGDNIEMFEKPAIFILHDLKKKCAKILDHWSIYLLPVMQEFQNDVKFLVCDFQESQFQSCDLRHYYSYWNYSWYGRFMYVENSPRIFGIDSGKHLHEMSEFCSYETINDFVLKTVRNELFKSEPIPANDSGVLIRTAVGNSFQELVLNNQHDVFLQIYNSNTYDTVYNSELLLQLKKIADIFREEDIEFIEIDAHKNYMPLQFYVGSYFIPKARRDKILTFNNIFCTKSLIKFLSANSSNELRGYTRKGKQKLY